MSMTARRPGAGAPQQPAEQPAAKEAALSSEAREKGREAGEGRTTALLAVLMWFVLNLSIGSLLMKWCLMHGKLCFDREQEDSSITKQCTKFDFPIFMTGFHMVFCWVICKPFVKIKLSLNEQLRSVFPLAAIFAASVGVGNMALSYVYPSFKEMVSTTMPLITMAMQAFFCGTRYNRWAYIAVPLISGGILLCIRNEAGFNLIGLVCCLTSAVFRAGRL
jgi:solute carrier family 35 protein E4